MRTLVHALGLFSLVALPATVSARPEPPAKPEKPGKPDKPSDPTTGSWCYIKCAMTGGGTQFCSC